MKRVLLVDGKNLVYRAHYGSMGLKDSKGRPTSVLHEFPTALFKVLEKFGDADIVVMWDNGHPLQMNGDAPVQIWRKEVGARLYKANRKSNPESQKALRQIPALAKMLDICGILQLGVPRLEADDLMGLAVTELLKDKAVRQIYLLSNDRDHYQLIRDRVMILYPSRQGLKILDADAVFRESGVWPHEWAAYKAFAGDSSDNYKAVKGIGPKQALQMIRAGVDPSRRKFTSLPEDVQRTHAHLRPYWEAIHLCYILSLIPESIEDRHFPPEARKQTKEALAALRSERVRRMNETQFDTRVQRLIRFLSGYDLDQLISRKRLFFKGVSIID